MLNRIQPQFVIQRSLYEARERPSKTFSWQTFMLSNILVELPWNTLVAVVLFFCWYYRESSQSKLGLFVQWR